MGDFETRSKAEEAIHQMKDDVIAADLKSIIDNLNKRIRDAHNKGLDVDLEINYQELMSKKRLGILTVKISKLL